MNKKICFLIAMGLCAVVLFLILRPQSVQEPEMVLLQQKRHISYGLVLKNNQAKLLKKAELWVYAPANEDPEFKLTGSHPASMARDAMGNRILHFVFNDLPPFATKILNVDVELTLQAPPRKQPLKNPDLFLVAEPLVQTKNPELIELAAQLHHEEPGQTLHNIYNWVSTTLKKSSYVARERSALYALRKKEGDCTEFMQLSLALCRINKIPARGVSGYLISQDTRLSPSDFHDWVEVYLDGAWQIVDPFNGTLMEREERYLVMRYHNPKESEGFSRWKSSDSHIKTTMTD